MPGSGRVIYQCDPKAGGADTALRQSRAFVIRLQNFTPAFGLSSKGRSRDNCFAAMTMPAGQRPHCPIINYENTEPICRFGVA